jgi:hypothetical protein
VGNTWAEFANLYRVTRPAALDHDRAKTELKPVRKAFDVVRPERNGYQRSARLKEILQILHLKWEHVDFERGLLLLPTSKTPEHLLIACARQEEASERPPDPVQLDPSMPRKNPEVLVSPFVTRAACPVPKCFPVGGSRRKSRLGVQHEPCSANTHDPRGGTSHIDLLPQIADVDIDHVGFERKLALPDFL